MARTVAFASTAFVILVFLMVAEMGPTMVAEARICQFPSQRFEGLCLSNTNCGNVCKTEGYPLGGHCHGFRLRCFCEKPCA